MLPPGLQQYLYLPIRFGEPQRRVGGTVIGRLSGWDRLDVHGVVCFAPVDNVRGNYVIRFDSSSGPIRHV